MCELAFDRKIGQQMEPAGKRAGFHRGSKPNGTDEVQGLGQNLHQRIHLRRFHLSQNGGILAHHLQNDFLTFQNAEDHITHLL